MSAWTEHAEALADFCLSRLIVRRDVYGAYKDGGGQYTGRLLTRDQLLAHFRGERVIGAHSTSTDGRCLTVTWDIDAHDDQADPEANWRFALAVVAALAGLGITALICDSNGKGGYHVRAFFKKPIPVEVARWLGERAAAGWRDHGLPSAPEVFPKQGELSLASPYGNWLRLPGKHHKRPHWTRIYDPGRERWLEGEEAVRRLVGITGDEPAKVLAAFNDERKAEETAGAGSSNGTRQEKPRGGKKRTGGDRLEKPDEATVRSALGHVPSALADSYETWLGYGMALHDWDSDGGLGLWKEFSAQCPAKYDAGACEAKWSTFTQGGGLTIGSIFEEAKRNGWEPPWDRNGKAEGESKPRSFMMTDLGNAERMVHRHGRDVRYCHPWKKWLTWDKRRWAVDKRATPVRKAKETVRSIYAEASNEADDQKRKDLIKHAVASEGGARIKTMLELATSEKGVPVLPEELDRDPWLLNCLNGTLDLRTGKLRPARREDLITSLCPVAFVMESPCSLWEATVARILGGNADLIRYFQALAGYSLTGAVTEQVLPILHGSGANGKSTLLGALMAMMGPDYAMKAAPDLLMVKARGESHPTDRADLFGKRLVVAIETGEGCRINEVLIKELTGGDKIRARRMREDFWEFDPTHKILLGTNHRPAVRGTDHAIWRRMQLIPFEVTIPKAEQDRDLPAKLLDELPGILAWCVRGCLDWQRNGLNPPAEVADATQKYREDEDVLAVFLAEHCIERAGATAKASALYAQYKAWAEGAGEFVATQRRFGTAMTERGFERFTNNGIWYRGLGLRADDKDDRKDLY